MQLTRPPHRLLPWRSRPLRPRTARRALPRPSGSTSAGGSTAPAARTASDKRDEALLPFLGLPHDASLGKGQCPCALCAFNRGGEGSARGESREAFLLAGLLGGLAHGYCFPVLVGQVVDRSPARYRGSAMAAFTALWQATELVLPPPAGRFADAHGDAAGEDKDPRFAVFTVRATGGRSVGVAREERFSIDGSPHKLSKAKSSTFISESADGPAGGGSIRCWTW